ncbi:MAG: Clp protease ClpP [Eubacteriales bacterium]|nr:Clp protease ClpP [Eubacteriales bacterium]
MPDIFKLAHSVKMSAEEENTAEVMLYGEIISNMPDEWKWDEQDKSAADFDKAIKEVRKNGATKLLLRINSPGGICTEAVAMRSILSTAGFEEINIRIEGLCASAATMIASLPKAHVAIAEGSEYMIHNPWCIAFGNANEMEHTVERLRNIEKTTRTFYAMKTGQSDEQLKAWMDAETWFTAEEAVTAGFADELLKQQDEPEIAACVSNETMETMKKIYAHIPKQISVQEVKPAAKTISHGIPKHGGPTEYTKNKEEEEMELKDLTLDQLREGNPDLFHQIQQNAVNEERERIDAIDALTLPGYEEMAEQAKLEGTTAMEFQKQVVAAQKQKGATFIQQRKSETAKAKEVAGQAPEANAQSEEQKANEIAESVVKYAKELNSYGDNGMF